MFNKLTYININKCTLFFQLNIYDIIEFQKHFHKNKMKVFNQLRSLLIFAAVVMFIYQTVQAVLRYVESPTVIFNSETKFNDEFKPR